MRRWTFCCATGSSPKWRRRTRSRAAPRRSSTPGGWWSRPDSSTSMSICGNRARVIRNDCLGDGGRGGGRIYLGLLHAEHHAGHRFAGVGELGAAAGARRGGERVPGGGGDACQQRRGAYGLPRAAAGGRGGGDG